MRLDEKALEVIMKECDVLWELYSQAEAGAQIIFNFYLLLVATIGGGIVLILQLNPFGGDTVKASQLLVSGLLVFAATIGSVYLSSLTGYYAHMSRYVQGIDAIRRHRLMSRTIWVGPTGTYQLFIASVNSLFLTVAVWLFLLATDAIQNQPLRSILAAIFIFLAMFVAYTICSRMLMDRSVHSLGIRVDTSRDMPFFTGKQ